VKPARKGEGQSPEGDDRLSAAKKSLEEMMNEIKPFIKRKKTKNHSTTGRWETTSTYKV
jgi:hypothetical protein